MADSTLEQQSLSGTEPVKPKEDVSVKKANDWIRRPYRKDRSQVGAEDREAARVRREEKKVLSKRSQESENKGVKTVIQNVDNFESNIKAELNPVQQQATSVEKQPVVQSQAAREEQPKLIKTNDSKVMSVKKRAQDSKTKRQNRRNQDTRKLFRNTNVEFNAERISISGIQDFTSEIKRDKQQSIAAPTNLPEPKDRPSLGIKIERNEKFHTDRSANIYRDTAENIGTSTETKKVELKGPATESTDFLKIIEQEMVEEEIVTEGTEVKKQKVSMIDTLKKTIGVDTDNIKKQGIGVENVQKLVTSLGNVEDKGRSNWLDRAVDKFKSDKDRIIADYKISETGIVKDEFKDETADINVTKNLGSIKALRKKSEEIRDNMIKNDYVELAKNGEKGTASLIAKNDLAQQNKSLVETLRDQVGLTLNEGAEVEEVTNGYATKAKIGDTDLYIRTAKNGDQIKSSLGEFVESEENGKVWREFGQEEIEALRPAETIERRSVATADVINDRLLKLEEDRSYLEKQLADKNVTKGDGFVVSDKAGVTEGYSTLDSKLTNTKNKIERLTTGQLTAEDNTDILKGINEKEVLEDIRINKVAAENWQGKQKTLNETIEKSNENLKSKIVNLEGLRGRTSKTINQVNTKGAGFGNDLKGGMKTMMGLGAFSMAAGMVKAMADSSTEQRRNKQLELLALRGNYSNNKAVYA